MGNLALRTANLRSIVLAFCLSSVAILPGAAQAGPGTGRHAVFAQVFGSAGYIGAGYDYRASVLSGRVGLATLPEWGGREVALAGPFFGLSAHVGGRHSLELGGEMTLLAHSEAVGGFLCGYRYEPRSGFFFRGHGLFTIRASDGAAHVVPGLSFGYSW